MKHAERFTKKELEDIINIENYIEQYKDDEKLICLNDVPEAITLWEIQDQNAYPSDVVLIRLGTRDNPDICVSLAGGDERSSEVSGLYSINEWTPEEMYEDFRQMMNEWLKKDFWYDDEEKKYRPVK